MQQGGGIGHDFSTLRPKGAPVQEHRRRRFGPGQLHGRVGRHVPHHHVGRRAARRHDGNARCDHPDIEAFIDAKSDPGRLRNFNLSVLVTDAFIAAVRSDAPWDLVFEGKVYRTVQARALWDRIMRATYDYAEPGVDLHRPHKRREQPRLLRRDQRTNPCGEQPLPPYGACLLGSINLARLVDRPFTRDARLDEARLEALTATAVRFLDNVIDVSNYPLASAAPGSQGQAPHRAWRDRAGRCADPLAACATARPRQPRWPESGWPPSSEPPIAPAPSSPREKGAFPLYRRRALSRRAAMSQRLPEDVRDGNRRTRHPQRPAHLDRAHRHHLAARRQRVKRRRAGVRLSLRAPCARARRHARAARRSKTTRTRCSGEKFGPRRRCRRHS